MTPRQLHALRERHLEQMQREELLVGIVAATGANFSFCRPDKALTPESFMLHPFKREPEIEKPLTGEDLIRAFAGFPKSKESIKCRS